MTPDIRLLGLYAVIPAAVFLTVSFFVLFAAERARSPGLQKMGRALAVLLWGCAALILATGLYTLLTGRHPALPLIQYLLSGRPA